VDYSKLFVALTVCEMNLYAVFRLIFSIIFLISAGASPVFGFCVDKFGRNVTWSKLFQCFVMPGFRHLLLAVQVFDWLTTIVLGALVVFYQY
jgi:hypothetical protein